MQYARMGGFPTNHCNYSITGELQATQQQVALYYEHLDFNQVYEYERGLHLALLRYPTDVSLASLRYMAQRDLRGITNINAYTMRIMGALMDLVCLYFLCAPVPCHDELFR